MSKRILVIAHKKTTRNGRRNVASIRVNLVSGTIYRSHGTGSRRMGEWTETDLIAADIESNLIARGYKIVG